MFSSIKRRLGDMATITTLCSAAERHANAEGKQEPGAEHFVLAALELPDGSAAAAMRRLHADADSFRAAVEAQYSAALADAAMPAASAIAPRAGTYRASASGQALMQELAAQDMAGSPLLGAHILLAASKAQRGVTARALEALGATPAALADAARAELRTHA